MDISKCSGEGCDKRAECYRWLAKSSEYRQIWFMKPPVDEGGKCDYFWDNELKVVK